MNLSHSCERPVHNCLVAFHLIFPSFLLCSISTFNINAALQWSQAENPLNTHTYLAPWSSQLWPDRCAHADTPLSAILAGGTCLWCIHSRNKEILFVLAEVEITLGQRDSLWGTALFQGTPCVCRGETFLLSLTPFFTTTCLGPLLISQFPFPNWKWR